MLAISNLLQLPQSHFVLNVLVAGSSQQRSRKVVDTDVTIDTLDSVLRVKLQHRMAPSS